MSKKIFTFTVLAILSNYTLAYNENDVFNAQTNYQSSIQAEYSAKRILSKSKEDVKQAEYNLDLAQKSLLAAQKDLDKKRSALDTAQTNYNATIENSNQAKVAVDNIWNQVYGSDTTAPKNSN